MENVFVSVIVPSYNRAHILAHTLPSYIQSQVGELILVDDCSLDNTSEVVSELQRQYPCIRYIRNPRNSRQCYSLNRGIEVARYPFLYIGDDDSILAPDSISYLLQTQKQYDADIVAAQALYMRTVTDMKNMDGFIAQVPVAKSVTQLVDLSTLSINFAYSIPDPIEVPVCQACILVKTPLAKRLRYDEQFTGNSYRQETDFVIRASLEGAKVIYDSRARQINLPMEVVRGGGAHSSGPLGYYRSAIKNNAYFLRKNYPAMQAKWHLPHSISQMQKIFRRRMRSDLYCALRLSLLRSLGLLAPLQRLRRYLKGK